MTALDLDGLEALIRAAVKFADWAAGEGICPVDQSVRDPETFLMEYSNATGDEDWETYAERISSSLISRVRSAEAERDGLRGALAASHTAMAGYYRYFTGGETRGSYDGRPERANLWEAMHLARAALQETAKQEGGA